VTLGASPVLVGSDDRLVSFVVAGAPAVALVYRLEGDRVVCEDRTTGRTDPVEPGDRRQLGRVAITVCSPVSSRKTGYTLKLSNRKSVVLLEGLPLTAEDLPGLTARGEDGIVALVSRHPSQPTEVLLRNRSQQSWSIRKADGSVAVIEPGRAMELGEGVQVNFGEVQGEVVKEAAG
jgi:hypothetical protein